MKQVTQRTVQFKWFWYLILKFLLIPPTPLQSLLAFFTLLIQHLVNTIQFFSVERFTFSLLQMSFCMALWFCTFKQPQRMFDLFLPFRRHKNAEELLQMPMKNIPHRKVTSCPAETDLFVHPYPWGYRQNTEIAWEKPRCLKES